jgi:hypothetical protein
MGKKVLARKTSRSAVRAVKQKQRVVSGSRVMRYARGAVQTVGSMHENPQMFGYGQYAHTGEPSLEEATEKAREALNEGRLRAAVTYALDISELLARIPGGNRLLGGKHFEAAEEAREVGDRVIARLQESLRGVTR